MRRKSANRRVPRGAVWTGPLLLAGAGAILLGWTWGTWPDVIIDFGRELYVPWQLAAGQTLFRDIAWFNGPLSPGFNALCFTLFGTGLRTLVLVNLVLLAALTLLLYRSLARMSGRFAATAAGLVFLLIFAFGQYLAVGNFNYLCPYSHEATHGVLLAIAALACLPSGNGRPGRLRVGMAGLALGLCFLTKAEIFLAAAAAGGLAFALHVRRAATPHPLRLTALLAGAALAPVLVAFLWLASALPAAQAFRAILGAWPAILRGDVEHLAFYREGLGLDHPLARLGEMAAWTGRYASILLPASGLAFAARARPRLGAALAAGVFITVSAALLGPGWHLDWLAAARPLPLLVLAIGAGCAVSLRPSRTAPRRPGVNGLAFSVFALVLLFKMVLNARVHHYGFVLAMPATLLAVVALTGWIPEWLRRRGADRSVFLAAVLPLLAFLVVQHLRIHAGFRSGKTVAVGRGADRFLADARGMFMPKAVDLIRLETPPGGTVAVLPEGVMINYLARRVNPTPYINFMPPEFLIFGEDRILAAYRRQPPDIVVLIHRSTREYGYPFFGRDYGRKLYRWVVEHYEPIRLFGQPPLEPGTVFGVLVMARRR